jgi:serine/threonine protein kinase
LQACRSKQPWKVLKKVELSPDRSVANYSVGYVVEGERGRRAFMKASDPDLVTDQSGGLLERLRATVLAHGFERQILEHCRGNNMDRIVVAIDYGDCMIDVENVRQPVFFLVFELAQCDMRVQVDRLNRFDLAWSLNVLHNLAVAIQQLHSGQVTHNDIKPSNLLVFEKTLQKLADLGRATSPLMPAIHDELRCIGDPVYAAPECLYISGRGKSTMTFSERRACDLYHLGSMAHFLVSGRMITPEIVRRLAPEHRPPTDECGWHGAFAEVLPFWREAFSRVLEDFDGSLPRQTEATAAASSGRPEDQHDTIELMPETAPLTRAGRGILEAVAQLAEPDPRLRGDPLARLGSQDQQGVTRYISLFDRLRKEAIIRP